MFRPFNYSQNFFHYLSFQPFDCERTWWRLFQKRVVRTKILGDKSWIRKWRDYSYSNGTYPLSFVAQIFHNYWLVIAYRPEGSISVIFRTRTSLILNENYIEMREGWVKRVNGCRLPLRNMDRWIGTKELFFCSCCSWSTFFCWKCTIKEVFTV